MAEEPEWQDPDWTGDTVPPPDNTFAKARRVMREALQTDEGLMLAYMANVAMCLHDRCQGVDFRDPVVREKAANEILALVFGFNED